MTNSQKYDMLFKKAELFMKENNPCKIENGTCLRGRTTTFANFCCSGCSHLKEEGCSVKALRCKSWLCPTAEVTLPLEKRKELYKLGSEIEKSRMSLARSSKEENLKYINLCLRRN